ncbi:hypothetical protein SARC_01555 [Sphaeroforma arctica JP610]|uniref:RanBP2-type domain-containing protein n=1 Tax=Sphaeroforma arctica JP610 TaxID=667725 RepID=A0A0L0GDG6_9EUKA|nr:hypothetical protein SARC_01555 [Sphaeroforma arctica JP610]KNC86293.1 hypothetical protein SARC_01555 [Sphaeroforma arctica JP610]|eukprot:XP_014160195.1 hypothetical protein SARC_01555 [Sphaeroforma arctica JP610]
MLFAPCMQSTTAWARCATTMITRSMPGRAFHVVSAPFPGSITSCEFVLRGEVVNTNRQQRVTSALIVNKQQRVTYASNSYNKKATWICEVCKASNYPQDGTCVVCDTKRMRIGDWSCAECQSYNPSFHKRCGQCRAQKSEVCEFVGKTEGQWMCAECTTVNYKSRLRCSKCNHHRDYLKGNWTCPHCQTANYHQDNECRSCAHEKTEKLFSGTWRCLLQNNGCGKINSVATEECTRCGHEAEHNIKVWLPWYCQSCHAHNPSKRKTCYICGYPSMWKREGGVFRSLPRKPVGETLASSRWECSKCTYPNSAHATRCHQCSAFKDAKGAWTCKTCKGINWSYRQFCINCGPAM